MTTRAWAVALCAAACLVRPAAAQISSPAPLVVPYLPQTEALCGGAAAAMVMRYWGAQDVFPDIFQPLIDRSAGGIRTSALAAALEQRHWTVVAGGGDAGQLGAALRRRHPVIALIEDRPGRFHYVVVVAATAEQVIVHDPARAPSRVLDIKKFDAAWQKSDRWMLVLLPGPAGAAAPASPAEPRAATPEGTTVSATPGPCGADVDAAVALATRGDKAAARRALAAAATTCPNASAPWRELAGIDALEQDWPAAAAHAERAVAKDPHDEYAWRVLATAEYVRHRDLEALAAWNHVGEPRTDLVNIAGLQHTRYLVIADAIGVRPKALLTPGALRLARRRVLAVPAVAAARLSFQPAESGRARIDAAVIEHTRAPTTYASWLAIALRAGTDRELASSITSVSGGGDVFSASWRWWAHRPMAAASYAAPGPWGIWRIEASRETQSFGASPFEETRARAGAEIANWVNQRTRVRGGAAMERWTGLPRTGAVSGRVEFWPVLDAVVLEAGVATWQGPRVAFHGGDVAARWRGSSGKVAWRADGGYRAVTARAPASIWPGADTGHARDVLLRAHPLLDRGVIRGGVFGRRLAFGTMEVQHWRQSAARPLRFAPAAFIDIARATGELAQSSRQRIQVDAGLGLRVSLFGLGVLRADLARGLRDGRTAFSVGWQR